MKKQEVMSPSARTARAKVPVWLGGMLLGVALVCFGMAWSLVMAGLALLATGWFATGTMTLLNAKVQETAPNEVRGRVMSLYTWLAVGMPALGGRFLGTLMGFFPPQMVFVIGDIMLIVVTLVVSLGTQQTNTDDGLARSFMSRRRKTLPSLPERGRMQSDLRRKNKEEEI